MTTGLLCQRLTRSALLPRGSVSCLSQFWGLPLGATTASTCPARANLPPALCPALTRRAPPCVAERRKPRIARRQDTRVGDATSAEQGSNGSVQTLTRHDVISPPSALPIPRKGLGSPQTPTPTQPQGAASPLTAPHDLSGARHLSGASATSAQSSAVHVSPSREVEHREEVGEESGPRQGQTSLSPDDRAEAESAGLEAEGEEDGDDAPSTTPLYRIPNGLVSTGKNSKVKGAEFIKSSSDVSQCPQDGFPEIAVIGRSNVGKSSLINLLTRRRELAQTSKKPGKTQLINHFLINGNWYLVDLPGYGYAKAPTAIRTEWHGFTQQYFLNRPNLATVLLLVDASIPPLQVDLDCADWLGQNKIPVTVVFTKCDRRKKKKNGGRRASENVADFERRLSEYYDELPPWIMTSSVLGMGKDTLLGHVAQVIQHWKS